MPLTDDKIKFLEGKALDIRRSIIEMLIEAKSGHTAGPLDMADVFAYLYFHALKQDPKKPDWPYRDRLVLSNGHICPVLYATMAHAGYFPIAELMTLRKLGSRLQGHPHREWLPMLETSSGTARLRPLAGRRHGHRRQNGHRHHFRQADRVPHVGRRIGRRATAGKRSCSPGKKSSRTSSPSLTATISRSTDSPRTSCRSSHCRKMVRISTGMSRKFAATISALSIRRTSKPRRCQDDHPSSSPTPFRQKASPNSSAMYEWHGKPPTTPEEIEIARQALGEIRTFGGRIRNTDHN